MKRYNDNLKARMIKLTEDDKYMAQKITERHLKGLELYEVLEEEIKSIIVSNVLIVATTDNVKRMDNKIDIVIGNIPEAIKLVMKDVKEGSSFTE